MTWRLQMFLLRLLDYVITVPLRFLRLIKWLFWISPLRGSHKILRWISGLLLLIIDLTPIPFLFECFFDLIKVNTRPLTTDEQQLAEGVFKESLPYQLITMDPGSLPVHKNHMVAFVSFHTINYQTQISSEIFIHELVHIWQYRKYGAVYISESVWAQRWGGGYNYGGYDVLRENQEEGLQAFNYEQQAEIIEEYFRLKNDLPLQWSVRDPAIEKVLEGYVLQLNEKLQ